MVWDMKTKCTPNRVQKVQFVVDKRISGMDDSIELLKCNEDLPSSPRNANNDQSMEYDDLPELRAVETDRAIPAAFQLSSEVSHQECPRSSRTMCTSRSPDSTLPPFTSESDVNWLTELANIATSPQSPLMQCTFYDRFVYNISQMTTFCND
ncbi:HMG box-containing protein 1-like [Rhincodon typus]|uniref:HMG box-containing protein 1-like n=1 Tax=Rhincodon typus TaxID=259920 RepID=UPI00202EEA65|nr:HMG box-containing protein 1-like [Rhincodon typus]